VPDVSRGVLEAIREHAQRDYPEECCGLLLGPGDGPILASRPVPNARRHLRGRRFSIRPEDYVAAEQEARRKCLEVLGFYHSHPDHPARPSRLDQEHALPNFHYIVVAVGRGRAEEITCWRLSEDRAKLEQENLPSAEQ
jgi:proteasome lid subunit RPN8/RPN11